MTPHHSAFRLSMTAQTLRPRNVSPIERCTTIHAILSKSGMLLRLPLHSGIRRRHLSRSDVRLLMWSPRAQRSGIVHGHVSKDHLRLDSCGSARRGGTDHALRWRLRSTNSMSLHEPIRRC